MGDSAIQVLAQPVHHRLLAGYAAGIELVLAFYILRIAYRISWLNVREDDRSEDEGEDDDEEVTRAEEKSAPNGVKVLNGSATNGKVTNGKVLNDKA